MSLASVIRQWQTSWAQTHEYEALGADERQALARDVGVAEEVLAGLVARGPEAAAELSQLMAALLLDDRGTAPRRSALMRDMTVVCSDCTEKSRCRLDLGQGRARMAYGEYCPNAETLQGLQDRSAAHS